MKIEIKRTIKLNFSADDWSLYEIPGRENAAQHLNKQIAERINAASGPSDFKYSDVLSHWSDYGAADSEGFHVVNAVVKKVWSDLD